MPTWIFSSRNLSPSEAHASLMAFAREQQRCRYQQVLITPVLQKKDLKEERFLSETESWEALNETWAVFVGWAMWTQLEVDKKGAREHRSVRSVRSMWPVGSPGSIRRSRTQALSGYYEPEDPSEKVMARKRFLAPEFRLSAPELLAAHERRVGKSGGHDSSGRPGASACLGSVPSCTWSLRCSCRTVELFLHRTYPLDNGTRRK